MPKRRGLEEAAAEEEEEEAEEVKPQLEFAASHKSAKSHFQKFDGTRNQFDLRYKVPAMNHWTQKPPASLGAAAQANLPQQQQHEQLPDRPRVKLRQLLILVLFVFGLIVCLGSLVCILMLPHFVSQQISKRLVLKNNSLLLDRWARPNVPMYFKVWMFDLTNAQELMSSGATSASASGPASAASSSPKAKLREIGPFVFALKREKQILSLTEENVYYIERRQFVFQPQLSCCSINTTVTIPNIPLVAVVDRALGYNLPLIGRFIPRLINRTIRSLREQLFVRKQVGEILFDGYDVDLLRMVSRLTRLIGVNQPQPTGGQPPAGSSASPSAATSHLSERFAIFKDRNNTWRPDQDGVWAINTGAIDRQRFGRVTSWNSFRQLPFWADQKCNQINGSDGTLFPLPIKKANPLYIFNQELCRSVNLIYDRPSEIHSIQSYRFVLNPENFAHTTARHSQSRAQQQRGPKQPARLTTLSEFVSRSPLQPTSKPTASQPSAGGLEPQPSGGVTHARRTPPQPARVLWPSASEVVRAGAAAVPQPVFSMRQPTRTGSMPQAAAQVAQLPASVAAVSSSDASGPTAPRSQQNPHPCFCDRKSTSLAGVNVCDFDGLMDLSRCSKQAQVIFGSMPHFYTNDARLLAQVSGLRPNASAHTTYLDIEPNTGLVLGGKRRVQLNLLIRRNNEINGFENINDMLIPIIWFEESAQINEESAQKFRSLYTERVRLVNLILISLLIGSLALLIVDAKLILSAYNWRRFKFQLSDSTRAMELRLPSAGIGLDTKQPVAPTANLMRSHSSPLANLHLEMPHQTPAIQRQKRPPHSSASSDTPLLAHSVTPTTTSSSTLAADDESGGILATPESSPEMRKWTPRGH